MDGDYEIMDSYRAELEGIRALSYYIRFLRRTQKDFVEPIRLTIWIDNEQALRNETVEVQGTPFPDKLLNESDIVADIQRVSHDCKIQWNGQHVKSHQEGASEEMPLEVRLNEECDRLAKQCLRETRQPSKDSARRSPTDAATLCVGGRMITNNVRSRLQYAAMSIDMEDYLRHRNEWDNATLRNIDWEHFDVSLTRVFKASRTKFSRVIKMNHDIQNTGRQKKLFSIGRHGPEAIDLCPCCMLHEETTMHLYQCRSPAVRSLLKSRLDELEEKLRQRHMPSAMWTAIRLGVESYCNTEAPPAPRPSDALYRAVKAQHEIGWNNFLKGRVTVEWGQFMGGIYTTTPSLRIRESRRRFMTTMIECLWDLYDTLWKHQCDLMHNNTDVNALSTLEVDRRIAFFFSNKTKLFDSSDYDRFHLGLQNTLALPMPQKKAWLETLAHRQIATERARKRLINRILPITTYFDEVDDGDDTAEK